MKELLLGWKDELLVRAFMWLGQRIFLVTETWSESEDQNPRVIYFADSARDINMAARCHVDWLEEQLENRKINSR